MGKRPLESKTVNTALVQLVTAALVGVIGFFQGDSTANLLEQVLGPEGVALSVAALLGVKSFWDIWVRFHTTESIRR